MKWLFQEPEWIIGVGVVVLIVLAGFFVASRAKPFFPVMGGAIAVIVGLLIVERIVVTDEEKLRETLDRIIRDVESGDVDAVLQHLHADADHVREEARKYLDLYDFHYITMTKMHGIVVDAALDPPRARMKFIVQVELSPNPWNRNLVGGVTLHLTKTDDRWLVHDYEEHRGPDMFKKLDVDDTGRTRPD